MDYYDARIRSAQMDPRRICGCCLKPVSRRHEISQRVVDQLRGEPGVWRGPHADIEATLMMHHGKDVALIASLEPHRLQRFAEMGLRHLWVEEVQSWLVWRDARRARMVLRTIRMYRVAGTISWERYSAELGLSLGYTKHQIRMFIRS